MTELTKFFPFLAVFAPVFLFFGQIRSLISRILSIFIVRVEMRNMASIAFAYYTFRHGKLWPLGAYRYDSINDYSQIEKKRISIIYEAIGKQPQLIKIGKSLVFAQNKKGNDSEGVWSEENTVIYYIRGTFNHEKVLESALDLLNARDEQSRFKVVQRTGDGNKTLVPGNNRANRDPFASLDIPDSTDIYKSNRIIKYKPSELGTAQPRTSIMNGYVFCEQGRKLYEECRAWHEAEKWYRNHGILWRRGTMIHGLQGSGKTSLIRKICQLLDIPLYVFDLASMSNKEFMTNWLDCQNDTPCAVLFDDIDKVFHGQENIVGEDGGGLSFDSVLAALSGAQPAEGILFFCTANDITKVDQTLAVFQNGLISRPGRIDSIIEIGLMEEKNRRELARQLLSDDLNIEEAVKAGEGMTAAQFNNYLTNLALDHHWSLVEKK